MRISGFGRVTHATAVLCGLVALLLAGCASALPIVARAPGERVPVEASSREITAQNVGQLEEERRQVASIGKVLAVRFAPGGHILSSLGADRVSRRWDADTGRLLEEVFEHYGPGARVTAVDNNPGMVRLAREALVKRGPFPATIALLESLGAVNNHNCVTCQ